MPTLEEEYAAWKATSDQKREMQLEAEYRAHQADLEKGGSVRQGEARSNFPVGATVGGMAGAGIGLAATGGTPVGALIGGALGTAVGEVAQQGYELLKDPGAAPRTLGEAGTRVAEQEAYQLAGEGVGRLTGSVIAGRRLAPGIPGSILPKEQQAMDFLTTRGYSQGYMPAEVTEARGLDVLHNIAEYSLFGGSAIKKFRDKRDAEVFADLAEKLIGDLGPKMGPEETGRAVVRAANNNLEMAKIPIAMEYNMIESMAAPGYTHVPTRMNVQRTDMPITKEAVSRMSVKQTGEIAEHGQPAGLEGLRVKTEYQDVQVGEQLQRLKVMTATQEMQISGAKINLSPLKDELSGALKIAQEAGGLENKAMGTTMLTFLSEKPDMVSYPVAKQIRTELRALRDGLANSPETKNAPAIVLADKAYASMTNRIEAGLRDYDPFLADRWKDVNFREAGRQSQFNNDIVRALVKDADRPGSGKPEAIVDQVFQHNNGTTIKNIKNALDAPTWDKVLAWHLDDVYKRTGGNGERMREALFGATSGIGEREMIAAYGPERVKLYKEWVNAVEIAQKKGGDSTGKVFIQLTQAGAILTTGGLLAANLTGMTDHELGIGEVGTAATILIGPSILAKLMTKPEGIRWIIQGMKIPAGTREATALAGRILPMAFPRLETRPVNEPLPTNKTSLPTLTPRPMGDRE